MQRVRFSFLQALVALHYYLSTLCLTRGDRGEDEMSLGRRSRGGNGYQKKEDYGAKARICTFATNSTLWGDFKQHCTHRRSQNVVWFNRAGRIILCFVWSDVAYIMLSAHITHNHRWWRGGFSLASTLFPFWPLTPSKYQPKTYQQARSRAIFICSLHSRSDCFRSQLSCCWRAGAVFQLAIVWTPGRVEWEDTAAQMILLRGITCTP